jgi:hypothetical protein
VRANFLRKEFGARGSVARGEFWRRIRDGIWRKFRFILHRFLRQETARNLRQISP